MIYFSMFQIRFTRVPHNKWTEEGDSKIIFFGYHWVMPDKQMTLLSALLYLQSWPQALSSNPREEACLNNPLSALLGLSLCLSLSLPVS